MRELYNYVQKRAALQGISLGLGTAQLLLGLSPGWQRVTGEERRVSTSGQQAETCLGLLASTELQPKSCGKHRDVFSRILLQNRVGQGLLYIFPWEIKNFCCLEVSILIALFSVLAALRPAATILPLCDTSS